jgi:hypothetical protein
MFPQTLNFVNALHPCAARLFVALGWIVRLEPAILALITSIYMDVPQHPTSFRRRHIPPIRHPRGKMVLFR